MIKGLQNILQLYLIIPHIAMFEYHYGHLLRISAMSLLLLVRKILNFTELAPLVKGRCPYNTKLLRPFLVMCRPLWRH